MISLGSGALYQIVQQPGWRMVCRSLIVAVLTSLVRKVTRAATLRKGSLRVEYYLGLGSNLGDRQINLQLALLGLAERGVILRCSPWYETAPLYVTDQPAFLNLVAHFRTLDDPWTMLARAKEIEGRLGRDLRPTAMRYGPRPVDIDLLFAFEDAGKAVVLDFTGLTIPHPRLAERAFVLAPLRDLAPDLVHPLLNTSIRDLADAQRDQAITLVSPLT